eukprot:TRINITY_DN7796_c0_g1_i1.p1 TRINITY_DN7796_c0_g1~~TRINITY_DN7796_c0_g1_i1.p1  ORF type:complete len:620 (+),score=228.62 TRINITY_DN7796_c0_g1_i1:83-1942(+)
MAPKDTAPMLTALRKLMKDRRYVQEPLAAYIVPSCDAHNSEYLADIDQRREAVSGFTGSAGTGIVTAGQAMLWTDGRYHLQARREMDMHWTLMKDGLADTPSQADWLCNTLGSGSVGVDPMMMGATAWSTLADRLDSSGLQLVPVETNLVDLAWAMDVANPQPARPENTVFPLEMQFTGRSWQDKVEEVRRNLAEKGADVLILSALDDVAWMLNLRGSDIAFNPVFFSYAAVTEKEIVLFMNPAQVTRQVRDALSTEDMGESVIIKDYSAIKDYISSAVASTVGKIWLSDTASQGLACLVPVKRRFLKVTPITLMKSIKNPVELAGFDACHDRDSAALCQYFCWLDRTLDQGEITEITGADRLEKFRAEQEHFMGLSFPSISSVGPNGAIIHYRPAPDTARPISRTELYLLDSGAQYRDGTTDVTRTIHLGTPTHHEKECFTRVLKGMIGLATAVFPNKTKGHCLDSFARQHLWQVGLDYLHGTGHGVGAFLNVHEGPSGISWRVYPNDPGLQAGMILSDEPGYYEDGNFGIRIETLVKVVEVKTKFTMPSKSTFLTFEPVTVVPIQAKMILAELMTQQELEWLNAYHQTCRDRVGPILKQMGRVEALEWLIKETQQIG